MSVSDPRPCNRLSGKVGGSDVKRSIGDKWRCSATESRSAPVDPPCNRINRTNVLLKLFAFCFTSKQRPVSVRCCASKSLVRPPASGNMVSIIISTFSPVAPSIRLDVRFSALVEYSARVARDRDCSFAPIGLCRIIRELFWFLKITKLNYQWNKMWMLRDIFVEMFAIFRAYHLFSKRRKDEFLTFIPIFVWMQI